MANRDIKIKPVETNQIDLQRLAKALLDIVETEQTRSSFDNKVFKLTNQ